MSQPDLLLLQVEPQAWHEVLFWQLRKEKHFW